MTSELAGPTTYVRAEAVEADLAEYLALPETATPNYATVTTAEVRQQFAANRTPPALPDIHRKEDDSFAGPGSAVAVRIYRMTDGPTPAILWFHGGGWVLGDLETAELPAQTLCCESGSTVISVDYRLAPESTFPGAFDDCLAALWWVIDNAEELAIDPGQIIVGGDSAGGNLAAAVALAARDEGVSLAGQLLIYPIVQAEADLPSYAEVGEGYGLTAAGLAWFWDAYVPDTADRTDWRAAPMYADLTATAPAFVLTCGFDPLASEGLLYADALRSAGVPVEALHFPAGIHGSFAMPKESGVQGRSAAALWVRSTTAT